ncbi:maleate cis-trans isomerase family protein [Streptomyces sp. NPDC054838]
MYRPDGWDARVRIGVLTPHADVGPESELRAMAPGDVGVHAARVPFGAMRSGGAMDRTIPLAPVRAFAEPPHVDEAAALLAEAPVDVLAFAFTSSAYVTGAEAEAGMLDRLSARARGLPVVGTCSATTRALHALGAGRIALVDPPWFSAELNGLGRSYYEAAGFAVVYAAPCSLPSGQRLIRPAELHDWIAGHVPSGAEAVVVGGNGFRAVGAVENMERTLQLPVLTANQVLLWAALRAAGSSAAGIEGYGQLFSRTADG